MIKEVQKAVFESRKINEEIEVLERKGYSKTSPSIIIRSMKRLRMADRAFTIIQIFNAVNAWDGNKTIDGLRFEEFDNDTAVVF